MGSLAYNLNGIQYARTSSYGDDALAGWQGGWCLGSLDHLGGNVFVGSRSIRVVVDTVCYVLWCCRKYTLTDVVKQNCTKRFVFESSARRLKQQWPLIALHCLLVSCTITIVIETWNFSIFWSLSSFHIVLLRSIRNASMYIFPCRICSVASIEFYRAGTTESAPSLPLVSTCTR